MLLARRVHPHRVARSLLSALRGLATFPVDAERLASFQKDRVAARTQPEAFWGALAEKYIHWDRKWDKVLDDSNSPFTRWFPGGQLNVCYNALDRHVEAGLGDKVAIHYDSPVTKTTKTITYAGLLDDVKKFAGQLVQRGVKKGTRVVIYMPMIPEAVVAMLACTRLGAIHSVVFGGFAAKELAVRIDDAEPEVIITASCGIEPSGIVQYKPLLDAALAMSKIQSPTVIMKQREQHRVEVDPNVYQDWDEIMADAQPHHAYTSVGAMDPMYLLYTSGTTGKPKGVVRPTGGHAVVLPWTLNCLYGIQKDDVWWTASDIGWVVGHSYIIYAPLLLGCTSVMFEGKPVGTPDAGEFFRILSTYKVKALFTAPTVFRAIRRDDPDGKLIHRTSGGVSNDLRHFKTLFLAGERSDTATLDWATQKLNVPVLDHYWQTETGSPVCCNPAGAGLGAIRFGTVGPAVPGWDVHVLSEEGKELPPGKLGELAAKLPLPPGCLSSLWHDDERFVETYMSKNPGYFALMDAGMGTEDEFSPYISVMNRVDDVISVAGHRISGGALEDALASHPSVAECAVIAVEDNLKGELPLGVVVLSSGVTIENLDDFQRQLAAVVRQQVGPVAAYRHTVIVKRLPKTRSGKVLRKTMRKIVNGQPYTVPATIEDPSVLEDIKRAFEARK